MTLPQAGYTGDLWMSVSPSIALGSAESMTDSGDHTTYNASVHSAWDWNQSLVIQTSPDGSTWTTDSSGDYQFIYPIGRIVFATARTVGVNNHVQISSGYYFTVTQLDGSFNWQNTVKIATEKTPQFQNGGWDYNSPTLGNGTVKVKTYRTDNRVLLEMEGNNLVVLQLFTDKANNKRWVGYALINGLDIPTDASKVMQQNPSFTWQGMPYYLTS